MADPMVIQTTPMVAAVPKDVPVSTETAQFNKKLSSKKPEGWISPAETAMISGTVRYAQPPSFDIAEGRCLPCIAVPTSDLVLAA